MKYEYGYTLTVGAETKTTIFGEINECELETHIKHAETANIMERKTGVRGETTRHPATYFVRPVSNVTQA